MTNHPNRSLPILDDNSSDAMVLGFACTVAGAEKIGRKHAETTGQTFAGVERATSVKVTYNPDINTRTQADRANAAGRGWVVLVAK